MRNHRGDSRRTKAPDQQANVHEDLVGQFEQDISSPVGQGQNAIEQLDDRQVLHVHRRGNGKGHHYRIPSETRKESLLAKEFDRPKNLPPTGKETLPVGPKSPPKPGKEFAPNKREKENQDIARVGEKPTGEPFGRFWAAWPAHKRKAAKKRCEAVWQTKGLDAHVDQIVEVVNFWKNSEDWTKDAGQFVPAPLVFLNGDRWDVDLEDFRASAKAADQHGQLAAGEDDAGPGRALNLDDLAVAMNCSVEELPEVYRSENTGDIAHEA